jgi:hypothetical protein
MALDDKQRDPVLAVVIEQSCAPRPQAIDMLRARDEMRFAWPRATREPPDAAGDSVLGLVVEGQKRPFEPVECFDRRAGAHSPNSA